MAEANGAAAAAVFFGSSPGELLGEQIPFFPEAAAVVPLQLGRESSTMRKLLPTVYSGPTIVDIETALAMSSKGEEGEPAGGRRSPRPAVAVPEKGFNKMENNKYTLRIKCCANGILADDGYKWRKYGQKAIKNSPNPRSYYRCTNPRCSAKKQVERSVEDPDTLVVTYEGLHLHYAYSHFLLPRPRDCSAPPAAAAPDPPAPKRTKSEAEVPPLEAEGTYEEAAPRAPTPESPAAAAAGPRSPPAAGLISTPVQAPPPPPPQQERVEGEDVPRRPQGLLEDIVPLLVRKPCSDDNTSTATLSSDDPSFSSLAPYSPPTSFSSTSFSWPHSPISTYFDQGVLFGTV